VDAQNLTARLAAQRAAFEREGAPTHAERKRQLLKLKQGVLARRGPLAEAVAADFGHRTAYETLLLEIVPVVHGIDYLRRHLRRWMRPERRRVAVHFQPGRAQVIYQPLGVVGIISPWNYPLSLGLMPLATAIAAGNRVMLKPSELTPATGAVLADVLRGVFAPEQVAVVSGDVEVGRAFAALPFDHLVFTGSTDVGRQVMRAASQHLVPVTLELGGKSPAIVQPGIPLAQPATAIAFGKLVNAGQTCIAPDYALVHEADVAPFVAAYIAAVRRLYPAGASDPAYSSIINARHCERLSALLEDARRKGAEIREIDSPAAHAAARARTLPPTLVLRTTPDMTISRQEIFGPILPIVSYRELDDAIAYVNARPHPLALYLFCRDARVRRSVLERTRSGNVTINDTLMHFAQDDLPFGGIGPSGMGAYHGREGFLALSHARGVFEQSPRWSTSRLTHPPFGRVTDALLRYLLR
jgi:coniferyl-aldehyde dehydrogenase